jgi:hypothetical protein
MLAQAREPRELSKLTASVQGNCDNAAETTKSIRYRGCHPQNQSEAHGLVPPIAPGANPVSGTRARKAQAPKASVETDYQFCQVRSNPEVSTINGD